MYVIKDKRKQNIYVLEPISTPTRIRIDMQISVCHNFSNNPPIIFALQNRVTVGLVILLPENNKYNKVDKHKHKHLFEFTHI